MLEARRLLTAAIWHNVLSAADVDNEGQVIPFDALQIINELNRRRYSEAPAGQLVETLEEGERPPFFDVNCDRHVTPLDALRVINVLNGGNPEQPWRFATSEVTAGLSGRYTAVGCHAQLIEGDALRTELVSRFALPGPDSGIRLKFDTPVFDTSSSGRMQDAFEVSVTDVSGQPLVEPYRLGRSASLNWSEVRSPVTHASHRLEEDPEASATTHDWFVDLAHLDAGTEVVVTARLINNDGDQGTSVVLRELRTVRGSWDAPPVADGENSRSPSTVVSPDLGRWEDVSARLEASYGRTSYTPDRSQVMTELVVTNRGGQTVNGPLVVVLDRFTDLETFAMQPDGLLADGRPFFDLTAYLDGPLAPGETSQPRPLRFTNPGDQPFQYRLQTWATLNSSPEPIRSLPGEQIEAGRTYRYRVETRDPEGDPLDFRLLRGPEGMTLDPATGALAWSTSREDVGRHSVTVRVSDPYGLSVEQSFAVDVVATLANRPPRFISDPVTEATASAGFEVTTVAAGDRPAGIGVVSGRLGPRLVSGNAGEQSIGVYAGENNDRFDRSTFYSTGEPQPTDSLFDIGYSIDVGLPPFTKTSDDNGVRGLDHGDLNGDGILDLAAVTYRDYPEEQVEVVRMLGDGDGNFSAPVVIASIDPVSYTDPRNLLLDDLNGDGYLDAIVVDRQASRLVTVLGNGDGSFRAQVDRVYEDNVSDFRLADIDEDGHVDLVGRTAALGFGATFTLMWMPGVGDGTFAAPVEIAAAGSAGNCCYQSSVRPLDIADLNGDGHLDIAIAGSDQRLQIYHSDGDANFTLAADIDPPGPAFYYDPDWIRIADFTGDGMLDIAYVHVWNGGRLDMYVGDGSGVDFSYREGVSIDSGSDNYAGSDEPIDIDGDGDLDLLFGTAAGSGLTPQVLTNDGQGNFTRTIYPPVDFAGQPVVDDLNEHDVVRGGMFADYNRDGVVDFSYFTSGDDFNGVGIRLGTRPGEFGSSRTIPWSDDRGDSEIHPGDFNGDGILDLLSLRSSLMFLGNGDGTFADAFPAFGVARTNGSGSIADFNLDGLPDVVAARANTKGSRYFVALANGDGTFEISDDQSVESSFYGYSATRIADFNNDGYPDFIAKAGVERHVDVHLNDPENPGTFQRSFRTTTSGQGINVSHFDHGFATEDFNNDGITDIVVSDQVPGEPLKLVVHAGDGDGHFEAMGETFAYDDDYFASAGFKFYYPGDLGAADFNEDGFADIVSFTTAGPLIHLGRGDGTFVTTDSYPNHATEGRGRDSYVIDFDEDGHVDLVLTGGTSVETLDIRRGRGDGTFDDPLKIGKLSRSSQAAFADLDHDGHLDITHVISGELSAIYSGKRDGLVDLVSADLDGDGNEEVLAVNEGNDRVKFFAGDDLGRFSRQTDLLTGRAPRAVTTGDLDGDGQAEIVVANRASRDLSILVGSVEAGYTSTPIDAGGGPIDVAAADLDGDSAVDLVALDDTENTLWVFRGNGTTTPDEAVAIPLGDRPGRFVLADATGDEILDAVVTLPQTNRVMILTGPDWDAEPPIYLQLPETPADVVAADFNEDGNPEVAVTLKAAGVVSVYYGRGDGQFARPQTIRVGESPDRVILADADEDGSPDLIVANEGDATLSVIYNRFDPNEVYRYDADAIDPDDDPLTYALAEGPGGLIVNSQTGDLLWAASPDQVGVHDVTVSADDGRGGIATQSFQIDVAPARENAPPLIATAPETTIGAGETFEYQVAAVDDDADRLRYRMIDGPAGTSIDPTTGLVSWEGRSTAMAYAPAGNGGDLRVPAAESLRPESTTVEGWLRLFDRPRFNYLMFQPGTYDVSVWETNQAIRVRLYFADHNDNIEFRAPVQPELDRWYHLAFTYDADSGTAVLYVDGEPVGSGTTTPQPLRYTQTTTHVGRNGGGFSGTQAIVENYRLWNYPRSAEEVREGLARQYSGDDRLVLDYRFEGPNTRTVRDSSMYGNDGYRQSNGLQPLYRPGGLTDPGEHPFVISVEDGRGGYDEQSFVVRVEPELRGAITGRLFDDRNGDGLQNDGSEEGIAAEAALPGWQVYFDVNGNGYADPAEPQAISDAAGDYRFDGLLPGSYPLRVTPTAGYQPPPEAAVAVEAGSATAFDLAIEQLMLGQIRGTLQTTADQPVAHWKVFADLDGDGLLGQSEPWGETDQAGRYALAGLPAGNYTVRPQRAAGWSLVSPAAGAEVTLAADAIAGGHDLVIEAQNSSVTGGIAWVTTPPTEIEARTTYRYAAAAQGLFAQSLHYDLPLAPEGMSIDPVSGLVAWRPTVTQVGEHAVVARARDDDGSVALQDWTVIVAAPNGIPVVTALPPRDGFAGVRYRYTLPAQDPDGDPLSFHLLEGPAAATIDPATGRIDWLPTVTDAGSHPWKVEVRDPAGGVIEAAFSVTVSLVAPDRFPLEIRYPRTSFPLGQETLAQIAATDALGRDVQWTLFQAPAGWELDAVGRIRWTPTPAQLGQQSVELVATTADGDMVAVEFTVEVTGSLRNSPPGIRSTPPSSAVVDRLYAYDLVVEDPDPLAFALLEAPTGMSLDAARGTLRWIPAEDQRGEAEVRLRVADVWGNEALQQWTIHVGRVGGPPRILNGPPTEAAVGTSFLHTIGAADAEGDPLSYRLLAAPFGMTLDAVTGELAWTPTPDQTGQQPVVLEVSDGAGGATTQAFAVLVAAAAANQPPEIGSTASRFAAVGTLYAYTLTATDPEGGPLVYSLGRGPDGMTIDAVTGEVRWTPQIDQVGKQIVTLRVTDPGGGTAIESWELDVLAENHPPQIGSAAPGEVAAGAEFQYQLQTSDADLDPLAFTLREGPAGATIDPFGMIRWSTTVADLGTHDFQVHVRDPRGGEAMQSFALEVIEDVVPPRLSLIENLGEGNRNILPWQGPFKVFVRAIDNVEVAALTLQANGQKIPLDAAGTATFTFEDWAFTTINATATAIDTNGNVTQKTITFDYDFPEGWGPQANEDVPTAILTSPADAASVTGMVSIEGTAAHEDFAAYKLSYRRVDEATFTEILQSETPVEAGELGVWDTSLLMNDEYVIRLEVATTAGIANVAEHRVGLGGALKLGNFRLAFTDMTIPVAGIPIEITRIYDTLQADREGDFGYGWRLEYRNTDLRVGLPQSGLEDIGIYSALRPGVKVFLNVPGQGRQGFTFNPDIRVLPGFGGENLVLARPRFTPDPGVTSRLSTGTSGYLQVNAQGELFAPGQIPYNPASPEFGGAYVLTTRDGITYRIDGSTGKLETATDRDGNTLEFSEEGVFDVQNDVRLNIARDTAGRITSIEDPQGNSLRYQYENGTLRSVIDREGSTTRLVYDEHRILEAVIDPLGREAVRVTYGADGRFAEILTAESRSFRFDYAVESNIVVREDALGNSTRIEYDDQGRIVAETDALGATVRSQYDRNGDVVSSTDALGNVTRYQRDGNGNITREVDPEGNVTLRHYDARNILLSETDPEGYTTTYQIRPDSRTVETRFANGHSESYQVDEAGDLISFTDPNGNAANVSYLANGFVLKGSLFSTEGYVLHDANGRLTSLGRQDHPTSFQYDRNGRLEQQVDPDGAVRSNVYDAEGQLVSSTDPRGYTTAFSYDADGNLIETRFPDGSQETRAYDVLGRLASVTEEGGKTTLYRYDAIGQLIETIYPDATPESLEDNPRSHREYDLAGNLVARVDELGRRTEYRYDARQFRTATVDAKGQESQVAYDARGNVSSETDARGNRTRYRYDARSLLVSVEFSDGSEISLSQDAGSRPTSVTNEAGETTRYAYSPAGELVSVTDAAGYESRYGYDEDGRLVSELDATFDEMTFEYDSLGRETTRIEASGRRWETDYDQAGNVVATRDPAGEETLYEYDARGRMVVRVLPDGTRHLFDYSPDGQFAQLTDETGTTRYAYDPRGRLEKKVLPDGKAIDYAYDAAGQVISITSDFGSTRYAYDAVGNLVSVTDHQDRTTAYSYDPHGNVVQIDFWNGVTEIRDYDMRNRLVRKSASLASTLITEFRYQRDRVGRIRQIEEIDGTVQYQYDVRGLLTEEAWSDASGNDSRTIRYEYDAEGNRVAKQDSREGTTTYAYDADDRMVQLQQDGLPFDYVYDLAGSLSEVRGDGQVVVYEWDGLERLIRAAATADGDAQWEETYVYNAVGERVGVARDGEEVRYLVDANREYRVPIAEYGANGNPTRVHVHGHHQISTSTNASDQIFLTGNNESVRVVTNAVGAVVQTVSYDAFGGISELSGGTLASSLFNNEPRSRATGLDYLRARYYDPSIGRFLSIDEYDGEVEEPLSRNRYLYAWSDPVNMTDPSGEQTLVETLVTAGMITLGAAGGAMLGHGLLVASWQAQGHHASTLRKDGSYYFVVGGFAIIGGVTGGFAAWGILSSGGPAAGGIAIEEAAAQGLISQGVVETASIQWSLAAEVSAQTMLRFFPFL